MVLNVPWETFLPLLVAIVYSGRLSELYKNRLPFIWNELMTQLRVRDDDLGIIPCCKGLLVCVPQ